MYVSVFILYMDKYRTALFFHSLLTSHRYLLYNGALFFYNIILLLCCCCNFFSSSFCYMYQLLYSTRAIILKYSIQRCSVIELIIKKWNTICLVGVCHCLSVCVSLSLGFISTFFLSDHLIFQSFWDRTETCDLSWGRLCACASNEQYFDGNKIVYT